MKANLLLTIDYTPKGGNVEFFKTLRKQISLGVIPAVGHKIEDDLWGDKRDIYIKDVSINTNSPNEYKIHLYISDFQSLHEAEYLYSNADIWGWETTLM